MDPEAERIRGYLQAQAAKLSLPELIAKVRGDMEQVKAALDSVPGEWFTRIPAEGEWSANEVAAHLCQTSAACGASITRVLDTGETPAGLRDRIEHGADVRDAAAWWEALRSDREQTLARVAKASGDERLDVRWNHPMFGDLNWREWVLFMRIHDLDHARQMESIAASIAVDAFED